jgi:fatty acid desaturase
MRYHHLRHHRDTGMATDPYHKPGSHVAAWRVLQTLRGLALVPFWTVRALVGSVASFTPALRRPYARIFLQDPGREGLENSREVIECAQAEWGQLAFQAAVFVAVASVPGPFLWGYLIPVSIAGMLAARRVLVEHSHEPTLDRRLETILASTNDHSLGLIGALFLAPRNIGFHIVHHLHPQARLGALPALRDWYRGRMGTGYPPAGVRTGSIQGP